MRSLWRRTNWRFAVLASGSLFFMGSCDPTVRTTVENGLITTSTSLFGAILRAMLELAAEQQTNTAKAVIDVVQTWVA